MMIRLDVPEGSGGGPTSHTYLQEQVRLGCGEGNEVRLTHEGVAEHHATVEVQEGQGVLIPGPGVDDLRVNGTPVKGRTLLQPGDRLGIGPVEVLYKLVPFPMPVRSRSRSWLEWATLILLLLGVFGQVFFLLVPSVSLRHEIEPARLVPTPTPEPLPTPDPATHPPAPTPTPVPLVSAPETGPEPTPSPPPQEDKAPDPDPIFMEANRLLSAGETFEAEQKFREALRVEPAFLPAKIALARLLSEQADFEESLRLWEQVRREAPAGSLEAMDARLEIPSLKRRLELLEQDREVPPPRDPDSIAVPTPVPLRPAFPTPSVAVREQDSPLVVERIRLERYPQSPRYDEFRILTFDLVHQEGTPAVEAGSIKIRVTFFEQAGARVRQADIPNPRVVLDVEQGLSRDQRVEDLSAAYEVPPGRGRDGRSYYGAIIEVFVDGQEVHRAADPEFLLKFIR
jgi:tetratricopeptide (TPR) repeat protein